MAATTYPRTVGGQASILHLPRWRSKDATGLAGLICGHGHGIGPTSLAQGAAWGSHPTVWADQGFAVTCVDATATWLNSTGMTAFTAAYNDLIALGVHGTKVALAGFSMGGGNVLRWLLENPTLVACAWLWSPLTDLDWAHGQAAWTTEVDTAYAGNYTANGAPRSPVTTATSFRGVCPIRIVHPTDDPTIPSSQTNAFLAAVNDPNVTLRSPAVTGGHTPDLAAVPPAESYQWLRASWAAAA